jgi:hypothetical protein
MTRRSPSILLTALCCLLALAMSASAEGAWVLWKYEATTMPDEKPPQDGWGPVKKVHWLNIGTRANRKDCEVALAKTPAPTSDVYYVCFPDTIDPRGPKGK